MNREYDVIVVGGGASGCMAAGESASLGYRTLLLERNPRLCRKILVTGKGRCNVCNHSDNNTVIQNVPQNGRFLYSALAHFSPEDTIAFFEGLGVPLKTERGNRVFPVSDRAMDIADALQRYVRETGVTVAQGRGERLLLQDGAVAGIATEERETYYAPNVILCCGGLSYPRTGSTGDGYGLAKQAGHTIVEPRPSLVPLVCYGGDCPKLQGLSLKNVTLTLTEKGKEKPIFHDFGELLFTHFGLSGPLVLSGSAHLRHMEPKRYTATIDLKPALSIEQLDARLQREFLAHQNKDFANSLGELLPKKLIPVVVQRSQIPPSEKCNQITREQRQTLLAVLKGLTFSIQGFRPIEEAIITSGGVSVKEVNPKTMGSKLVQGLYFAGELLDVDAYTGGFNLQLAFSTGKLAGASVYQ